MARTHKQGKQGDTFTYHGHTITRTRDGFVCGGVEDDDIDALKKLIRSWNRQERDEARCESMEAARYEDRAYGYD